MSDQEREDSYYHPAGVPVTPQARQFGYEFPVHVSTTVWREQCVAIGIMSKHNTGLDRRVIELLQYCYDGMLKRLTQSDDFLYYYFKIWYWSRSSPQARKKKRGRLGARLFLDPSTGGPWLYIFAPNIDSIEDLERGEALQTGVPETTPPSDDTHPEPRESELQHDERPQNEQSHT